MLSARFRPFPAPRPAPEFVASTAQPSQEPASTLSQLSLPYLSRPPAGGLRHELCPSPAWIDRPRLRSPSASSLPCLTRRQPAVLRVPLLPRFDGLLIVGGAHSGCQPNRDSRTESGQLLENGSTSNGSSNIRLRSRLSPGSILSARAHHRHLEPAATHHPPQCP